jgi:hypothetical protein
MLELHLRVFRQLATRLVDDIEDAAVERLVHVSPNVRCVRLDLSGRHHQNGIMLGAGTGCNGALLTAHPMLAVPALFRFGSTVECASRECHGN